MFLSIQQIINNFNSQNFLSNLFINLTNNKQQILSLKIFQTNQRIQISPEFMPPNPNDLTNPSFLEKLALELIKPRKSSYPEDPIYYFLQQNKFCIQEITDLKNKYNNFLKSTLVTRRLSLLQKVQHDFSYHLKNKNSLPSSQKCIIYLHGLGSNRMEGFSILPHLPKGYALFSFDLSGSGKSEGNFTSYGFKQKQDIQSVLTYLYTHKNYREFIIWGRSMGAVASLLFNNMVAEKINQTISSQQTLKSNSNNSKNLVNIYNCVKCIVADSPFCSFEEISKDIALNKMSIPTFFTQIALKFLENTFGKILYDQNLKQTFTPFQIDFTKNSLKPMFPIIFVYSLNDEIVKCEHSQKIIKSMEKARSKMVEKVIIPECGHNIKRPQNVIETIFQKIEKYRFASRNYPSYINQNNNQNALNKSFHKVTEGFETKTNLVRRKSFWNFEEQIIQNQPNQNQAILQKKPLNEQIAQNSTSKFENQNKFIDSKNINEKPTARRNIFNRQEIANKLQPQTVKRRGLSLSSTIQRMQSTIKENNFIEQSPTKNKINNHTNNKPRNLNMSVQIKVSNIKNIQHPLNTSPRKEIQKSNIEQINMDLLKNSKNRQSLGNNRDRISLGGSVEKKLKARKQDTFIGFNQKPLRQITYINPIFPAQKDQNKNYLLSTISYSNKPLIQQLGLTKKNRFLSNKIHRESQLKIINQNLQSEPNIMIEDSEYQRTLSRQSLNTIDASLIKNQVNENLTNFINKKLEFQFDNYAMVDRIFDKQKQIQSKTSQTQNFDNRQFLTQSNIKQNETEQYSNKISSIGISNHISLRPSTRLYHEKRKKKLQNHNFLISKQNQHMKITNQRYLIED